MAALEVERRRRALQSRAEGLAFRDRALSDLEAALAATAATPADAAGIPSSGDSRP